MRIAIPTEIAPGETRVAMTPDAVRRLASDTARFSVQAGAGLQSFQSDLAYREAGAEVVSDVAELWGAADVVLKVSPPRHNPELDRHEADLLREGAVLISLLQPHAQAETLSRLAARNVTALALELIPRITRAQSMDVLSAMSTLAGYKTVIMAADTAPRLFPLLMTAAGTLSPARVLVLGAGVAGLQAIATARRLGAVVEGYDIRPAVKEQVESLGARFVESTPEDDAAAETDEPLETAGGYAVELSKTSQERERRLIARHVAKADVVITTALVPGKRAPLLITADMVESMRPGSVIVDLAAEAGGNCELSEADESVVKHGVTIHAPTNLAATLPSHASQMYSRNLSSLLKHMLSEEGELTVDLEDDIVGPCCVTHGGEVRYGS
ncbi:MAG: Re/Si-specific NAD(P)(+) transhydrogenase subunit alpha [Gemmatimonadota bacterium]